MKPLSPLSRMSRITASMTGPVSSVRPVRLVNLVKTIRLLTAFSVAILLGAPLTFGQKETPQEPQSTPEQAEAPPQPAPQTSTTASTEAYERGLRHYRNRNFTQALRELGQVSQADADRADVLYLMGYCHYVLKHFQDSLDAFRWSLRSGPGFRPARDLSSAISSGRFVDGRTTPEVVSLMSAG